MLVFCDLYILVVGIVDLWGIHNINFGRLSIPTVDLYG